MEVGEVSACLLATRVALLEPRDGGSAFVGEVSAPLVEPVGWVDEPLDACGSGGGG